VIKLSFIDIWAGKRIEPQKLLDVREKKSKKILFFARSLPSNLISISLNLPGEIRDNAFFRYLLRTAKEETLKLLKNNNLSLICSYYSFNGQENYILLCLEPNLDPVILKKETIKLENTHVLGRIFDLDVIDKSGNKIERNQKRTCIVCGKNAIVCRRENRHQISELRTKIESILLPTIREFLSKKEEYKHRLWKKFQAIIAGIILEVSCTPKPGLVDTKRNSSHPDMNYRLFLKSTEAIAPFLYQMLLEGYNYQGSLDRLLHSLRPIGIEAEKVMFKQTEGVNTQKGLIFSAGLIAASVGVLTRLNIDPSYRTISRIVRAITFNPLTKELEQIKKEKLMSTAGQKAYLLHGIAGIRGEVIKGFPAVMHAKRELEQLIRDGYTVNQAMLQALFQLISEVEDTTLIKRGGIEALEKAQKMAKDFLNKGGMRQINAEKIVEELDEIFIRNSWTIGGCADLLAVTTTIWLFENQNLLEKEIISRDFSIDLNVVFQFLQKRLKY